MITNKLYHFFENLIFHTSGWHWIIVILLSPLSVFYCFTCLIKKLLTTKHYFGINIISIGNLTVGGSGKTPVTIAIAKMADKPAIVLRGYGRKSKGLIVVKDFEKLLVDVDVSGDEAMEYALCLQNSIVIVSEDRIDGIKMAKSMGATVVLLDDGFGKFNIKKFDIVLKPAVMYSNPFCLPAGPYRCPFFMFKFADLIIRESHDFKRVVSYQNLTQRMLLVTSISNPSRLEQFLPDGVVDRLIFRDHEYFDEKLITDRMNRCFATSIIVTNKDFVKLSQSGFVMSKLNLVIEFNSKVTEVIKKELRLP